MKKLLFLSMLCSCVSLLQAADRSRFSRLMTESARQTGVDVPSDYNWEPKFISPAREVWKAAVWAGMVAAIVCSVAPKETQKIAVTMVVLGGVVAAKTNYDWAVNHNK